MFIGSRKAVAHAAMHDHLGVTRAVVRWRGPYCKDIAKGVGGLQADGVRCCTGEVG